MGIRGGIPGCCVVLLDIFRMLGFIFTESWFLEEDYWDGVLRSPSAPGM